MCWVYSKSLSILHHVTFRTVSLKSSSLQLINIIIFAYSFHSQLRVYLFAQLEQTQVFFLKRGGGGIFLIRHDTQPVSKTTYKTT